MVAKNKSVIRFGDGEIALINGKDIVYQNYNIELARKLSQIINSKNNNILICLPDIFGDMEELRFKDRYFHLKFLFYYRKYFLKEINGYQFGNTFMSRPYMIFKDKDKSIEWFSMLKQLWEGREIVIIEGDKSKSGVGNTLFSNAKHIERIICPSKNAFGKYTEITNEILKMDRNKLYLLALGPTAKIVTFELAKYGYHAIDIGHLDSEYEWSLRNAKDKIMIEGKHTAEFKDEFINQDINDQEYIRQIINRIE